MSHPHDKAIESLRRQVELERKASIRGPISLSRRAEASVDLSQLSVNKVLSLRITEAGNGATVADIGKFWFTPGYSRVGGPDIVPES